MTLQVVNLSETARQIDRPFGMVTLGLVGDLSVNLYICQGQLPWHRHADEDELFLVHEGVVNLETELGAAVLYPEECAVVPKGIAHRSGSTLRSVVLLVRAQVMSDRKNGHGRLFGTPELPRLEKGRLARPPADLPNDFEPIHIAQVEAFQLTLQRGKGVGPRLVTPHGGALVLCLRGAAHVETSDGPTRLQDGEFVLLPGQESYNLRAAEAAMVARLQTTDN